ncbi:TIGR04149 family rSAM-modified RiPP [Bacteroides fluxus]|nr:TIGR04149 family rSAM-modified RiPP [Bacteroides fluxus]
MKKFNKISLSELNHLELKKKQQQLIFGGNACKCGSCGEWASTEANMNANFDGNITGTGTNDPICRCTGGLEDAIVPAIA